MWVSGRNSSVTSAHPSVLPWSVMYAGYRRVSRVGERDERLRSPDFQADRIRAAAAAEGVEVAIYPPELDVSGNKEARAILDDLVGRIERRELEGLVVAQFDRLSRLSMSRALKLLERIENAGGRVISAAEPLDPSTPEGRFTRNIFLSVASMERERKAAGFETSKAAAVERGIWTAPRVPVGYRKLGRGHPLTVAPGEAELVRELFERRAGGASWWSLVQWFSDAYGQPVDARRLQRIVKSRVYLGELRQGKHVNASAHPAIIDRPLWEAAQRGEILQPRDKRSKLLLSGLLRCASCGHAMITHSRESYICSWRAHCPAPTQITAARVEQIVIARVLHAAGKITAEAAARTDELDAAVVELATAERLLAEYNAPETQEALGAHWQPGLASRVERVDYWRRKVGELRARSPKLPAPIELAAAWPTMNLEDRRAIIRGAVGVVWVRPGRNARAERDKSASDRVRVIARGFERVNGEAIAPLVWNGNVPGELPAVPGEDS